MRSREAVLAVGTCGMVPERACGHLQPSMSSGSSSACCLHHSFFVMHTRGVATEEETQHPLLQEDLVPHLQNLHQAISQEIFRRLAFPVHHRALSCPSVSLASLGKRGHSGEMCSLFSANGTNSEISVAVPGEILQGG